MSDRLYDAAMRVRQAWRESERITPALVEAMGHLSIALGDLHVATREQRFAACAALGVTHDADSLDGDPADHIESAAVVFTGERLGVWVESQIWVPHRDRRCEACENPSEWNCGVAGVLARVDHNGYVISGTVVQRCDECEQFESDDAALAKLAALGMVQSSPAGVSAITKE